MVYQPTSTLWIFSELYYPEDSATGYYVTGVAEGLAKVLDVRVLCAQPTYAARGTIAPKEEIYRGVRIHRCTATALNKDVLVFRLINLLTISLSIFIHALLKVRPGDRVFVVTNPPTLPFVALIVCKLRKARLVLRIEDVYPEAMVAASILHPRSLVYRFLEALHRRLYQAVDSIVVLGRDMKSLVVQKAPSCITRTIVIPNWADLDQVRPLPRSENPLLHRLRLQERFVIQYSGNMGRTHDLESIIEIATRLQNNAEIHFLFIGSGAKQASVKAMIERRRLANVTILPPQKRSDLSISLNACDVSIISFVPGMVGVSVPSRMYNVLAAGKPMIAVTGKDSELAMLIREAKVGWIVEPKDIEGLRNAVLEAYAQRETLPEISRRARCIVEENYSYQAVIEQYRALLNSASSESL